MSEQWNRSIIEAPSGVRRSAEVKVGVGARSVKVGKGRSAERITPSPLPLLAQAPDSFCLFDVGFKSLITIAIPQSYA